MGNEVIEIPDKNIIKIGEVVTFGRQKHTAQMLKSGFIKIITPRGKIIFMNPKNVFLMEVKTTSNVEVNGIPISKSIYDLIKQFIEE